MPTSGCTSASVLGPPVSSMDMVLKDTLQCTLQEGIYTEHLSVLLDVHSTSRVKTLIHFVTLQKIVCL